MKLSLIAALFFLAPISSFAAGSFDGKWIARSCANTTRDRDEDCRDLKGIVIATDSRQVCVDYDGIFLPGRKTQECRWVGHVRFTENSFMYFNSYHTGHYETDTAVTFKSEYDLVDADHLKLTLTHSVYGGRGEGHWSVEVFNLERVAKP